MRLSPAHPHTHIMAVQIPNHYESVCVGGCVSGWCVYAVVGQRKCVQQTLIEGIANREQAKDRDGLQKCIPEKEIASGR